jgi:hypothetical protein
MLDSLTLHGAISCQLPSVFDAYLHGYNAIIVLITTTPLIPYILARQIHVRLTLSCTPATILEELDRPWPVAGGSMVRATRQSGRLSGDTHQPKASDERKKWPVTLLLCPIC